LTANRPVPAPPLSRAAGDGRSAAPVGLVHLGLGHFFRAHQAWYTEHAGDAGDWGYAAFAGRGAGLARRLQAQDGLYTLLQRGPQRDTAEIIASVSEVHPGADHVGWLACVASPPVAAITVTVTEAGYCRGPDGGLDVSRPDVAADLARLREDISASVATAPARLVAGLAARRAAGGGPLALVPCDNVAGNGALAGRVVTDLARLVDPTLVEWIGQSLAVVTTVVDRITPRTGRSEIEAAVRATGRSDEAPVVTEPFSEWVLAGEFPAGRPRWEDAGAVFTDDVTDYEHRKLWLLNAAHSLLAYAGLLLGHRSVAEAIGDDRCGGWVQQWWATAGRHLDRPAGEIATYEHALVERFANTRMHDELARIAEDGSQKLPIRVLPVLRAERAAGKLPTAATRIVAAWLCHLRGLGGTVHDVRADELVPLAAGPLADAARQVLDALDPDLGTDTALVTAVAEQCDELAGTQKRLPFRDR
jgi:fructuronate reductase